MTQSPTQKAWFDAFKPACRSRRMRFVSETGFVVDDVLWTAFLPDVEMGQQMRINRRINGAFTISPLRIADGHRDVSPGEAPQWDPIIDEFESAREEFIGRYPTAVDYVTALAQSPDTTASNRALTRGVAALIAADRPDDAVRTVDEALARGESGSMASTVDVLQYLRAYAKGPDNYAAFRASLIPTHHLTSLDDTTPSRPFQLIREHDRISMRRRLDELNGVDPFAVLLRALRTEGTSTDVSNLLYLQAAGTAGAMTVEFCRPGGADRGVVAVRSVVGRSTTDAGADAYTVDIVLPRSTETVGDREVFTAAEAADMFELFYLTDGIGDSYVLRPVEGYTAGGGLVDLSRPGDGSTPQA